MRKWAVLIGAPVAVVAAALWLPSFYLSLLNYIGLYAVVGVGLVLLTGSAGLTSFGQAAFVGVGAYTTAVLTTRFGVSPWLTLPAAMVLTGLTAVVVGAVTVRLSGHYLILGTMAWGIAIYYVFGNSDALGGQNGLPGIPPVIVAGYALDTVRTGSLLIWFFTLLSLLATANLLNSGPGRAIQTLRKTELARAFGVHTGRLRLAVFIYAAVLAGTAGWLHAHYLRFVAPSSFSIIQGFNYVFMIVMGGSAHLLGAVLGPAAFVLIQTLLQSATTGAGLTAGQYDQIIFGIIIILIMQTAAAGLAPRLVGAVRRRPRAVAPADAVALPRRDGATGESRLAPIGALLEVRQARKTFGGLVAVDDVSFTVGFGEIVALIGPNGAGKSTLFNLISGELALDSGSVWLQGRRLDGVPSYRIAQQGLARTFQQVRLMPALTVLENAAIGGHVRAHAGIVAAALHAERGQERRILGEAAAQLRRVGLGEHFYALAANLPLGHQRVAEIARALCADPAILLLDEPAAGLRFHEKQALAGLLFELRKGGMSILLVEHDMDFLMDLADRVVVMNFGQKLSEGTAAEVQADTKVIDAYLGGVA